MGRNVLCSLGKATEASFYIPATASISTLPVIPGGLVPPYPRFHIRILLRLKDDGLSGWTLGARAGMRGEASVTHHEATRVTFLATEKTAEEPTYGVLSEEGYSVRTACDRNWRSCIAPT